MSAASQWLSVCKVFWASTGRTSKRWSVVFVSVKSTSLFFLRALPIFPLSVISAGAGLLRLPIKQFTLWTFYGSIVRCLFLGYLGWGLGEPYQAMSKGIDKIESIVSLLLL